MKAEDIEKWIIRIPESGCWIWLGSVGKNGYGRANKTVAHRFVYSSIVGEIPDGKQLDHLCRVRCCVNPAHLEPVTQQENIARGFGLQAINSRKTHCIKGHEYSPENTQYRSNGNRRCVICHRQNSVDRWKRLRAQSAQKKEGE